MLIRYFCLWLVTLFVLLSSNAFALSGREHCLHILQVLGVERSHKSAHLAEAVTSMMDDNYTQLLNDIKSPMVTAGQFNLARYTHRLFFHWGFHQSPRSLSVLADQVRLSVEAQNLLVQQEQRTGADITRRPVQESVVWNLIEREWKKRRSAVLSKADALGGSKAEREALVTIMYNVHLLGDYSTSAVEALADLRSVVGPELCSAIKVIGKNSPRSAQLIIRIGNCTRRSYSKNSQVRNAAKLLELLKRDLPEIIKTSSFR